MADLKFGVGCPVQLTGGSMTMTVVASQFEVQGDEVAKTRCVWLDTYGVPHERVFSDDCLMVVNSSNLSG